MAQIDPTQKTLTVNLVYYGPGGAGKTMSIALLHREMRARWKSDLRGRWVSGSFEYELDYEPAIEPIRGLTVVIHVITLSSDLPDDDRARRLPGTDGVVFVVDSQRSKLQANADALRRLDGDIAASALDDRLPIVFQWNKRDLDDSVPFEEIGPHLVGLEHPVFEAVATTGEGVFPTIRKLTALVLERLDKWKDFKYAQEVREPHKGRGRA